MFITSQRWARILSTNLVHLKLRSYLLRLCFGTHREEALKTKLRPAKYVVLSQVSAQPIVNGPGLKDMSFPCSPCNLVQLKNSSQESGDWKYGHANMNRWTYVCISYTEKNVKKHVDTTYWLWCLALFLGLDPMRWQQSALMKPWKKQVIQTLFLLLNICNPLKSHVSF